MTNNDVFCTNASTHHWILVDHSEQDSCINRAVQIELLLLSYAQMNNSHIF